MKLRRTRSIWDKDIKDFLGEVPCRKERSMRTIQKLQRCNQLWGDILQRLVWQNQRTATISRTERLIIILTPKTKRPEDEIGGEEDRTQSGKLWRMTQRRRPSSPAWGDSPRPRPSQSPRLSWWRRARAATARTPPRWATSPPGWRGRDRLRGTRPSSDPRPWGQAEEDLGGGEGEDCRGHEPGKASALAWDTRVLVTLGCRPHPPPRPLQLRGELYFVERLQL